MLRDGMHVKVMSERLGHSSIAITLDTYSHVLPDMQRQALEQMDASLFDVSPADGGVIHQPKGSHQQAAR